ncbi:MAG: peptide deformylase [Candidatus Marinimicrobia bacterium]|jgi:peptide deformylase|nr:peptide deformylase [Candidatus Neomarinimicrobiota bacterium]MBT3618664.1 peptide deformylase [Candidatus Neomarinimicrobiota bacterium]MBT3829695.1 peptide deformylase [Candidatus Neomarinimicrobiota bacterium]MBT3997413.1 peptide deformylase [Candidatus Neomarinimicrobiota bacterium]MBT4280469.1 peptide deformylase [Candidatus Neomarinimicrobiota bacterium]
MAVIPVTKLGNPILRKKCNQVTDFSGIPKIVDDMFDTMYEKEGIGLAGNQVGLDLNLCVIDISHTEEDDVPHVFVNGEILERDGEYLMEEGCLSVPDVRLEFNRAERIRFRYQDINGDSYENYFDGLLARVIQHEIDHLNGNLIIDHVSKLVRMQHRKQLNEIKQAEKTILAGQ